jgi:hypothetical protein
MTPKQRPQPVLSEHGKREAARRQAREAAALRDNLKKRKRQVRERETRARPAPADDSGEA